MVRGAVGECERGRRSGRCVCVCALACGGARVCPLVRACASAGLRVRARACVAAPPKKMRAKELGFGESQT